MKPGSLILPLWWLYCVLVLGASASYHFRDGQTWLSVLYLLLAAVALTLLFRAARRIDREEA